MYAALTPLLCSNTRVMAASSVRLRVAAVITGVVTLPPVAARLSELDTAATMAVWKVTSALLVLRSARLTPVTVCGDNRQRAN